MLQLVEMEGRVTENGCIEIPMTVLDLVLCQDLAQNKMRSSAS